MFVGSKMIAGLAGAALATGLAMVPAQATLVNTNSYMTWSANVPGAAEFQSLTVATPFSFGGKTYQASYSPTLTPVTYGTAAFAGLAGASWLGDQGYVSSPTPGTPANGATPGTSDTIVIGDNTAAFPTAFGLYVEGDSPNATNNFTVTEYSSTGATGSVVGTMTFAASGPDTFLGFYIAGAGGSGVKSIQITDNAGATDQIYGDFFSGTSTAAAAAVPEPASVALLGLSLLGLGLVRRSKKA